MRQYSIYLIESDVAAEYFGKEQLLYNLFTEFNRKQSEKCEILQKQVRYITKEIPFFQVQQFIQKSLQNHEQFQISGRGFKIKNSKKTLQSEAFLSVKRTSIILKARGNFDAETMFFETLRKFDPCFLAMDFQVNRYGWLNPIKQRQLIVQ
jgi:hypothetical protein